VSLGTFIDAIYGATGEPNSTAITQALSFFGDGARTGQVAYAKFADVLRAFGPLQAVARNTRGVYSMPAYVGPLSSHEAELLLSGQVRQQAPQCDEIAHVVRARAAHWHVFGAQRNGRRQRDVCDCLRQHSWRHCTCTSLVRRRDDDVLVLG
jgi:hypothetical protein